MVSVSQKQLIHTIILVTTGAILTIIGAINTFFLKDILRSFNKKLIKLSPSMKFYEEWKDTPTHILNKIYIFNWTNPEDFERNGTKPAFTEMGPEYQRKVNLTWNANGTVSYRVHRVWYFDPENSNGTLEDNVTSINIVPLMGSYMMKDSSYIVRKLVSFAFSTKGEKIFATKTVRELTFEGYEYSFSSYGSYIYPEFDKLGFLYSYNDTSNRDGLLNIDTGDNDIRQVAQVRSWNYSPDQLNGGRINGTTGELFSSDLTKDSISVFTPWLCRNFIFDYKEETYVKGMKAYRFAMSDRNLDNGSKYPENLRDWPGQHFPSGIMNLSACYHNGVIIASMPHFYHADPFYASQVGGIRPDDERHDQYFMVEPTSGLPLKAKLQGQFNALVKQSNSMRLYRNIPDMIFPILWVEKSFEIPQSLFDFLESYFFVVNVLETTALPFFIVGIVILTLVIFWKMKGIFYRRDAPTQNASSNFEKMNNYQFTKLPQKSSKIKVPESCLTK